MHRLFVAQLSVALRRFGRCLLALGRAGLGWACVVVGVVITISPMPFGFLLVIAGVALLGPRDRALRVARVAWKRLLRRWMQARTPVASQVGRRLYQIQRDIERRIRATKRQARAKRAAATQRPPDERRAEAEQAGG